jgi:hypothetical protein
VSNGFLSYTAANARGTLAGRAVATWNHVPAWVPPVGDYSLQRDGDFGFHVGLATEWRPNPLTSLYLEGRHGQTEGTRLVNAVSLGPVWKYVRDEYVSAVFRRDALLPSLDLKANADVPSSTCASAMLCPTAGLSSSSWRTIRWRRGVAVCFPRWKQSPAEPSSWLAYG